MVWAAIVVLGMFVIVSTQLSSGSPTVETSSGTAKVDGPFSLVSHTGERVDNQSLAGRPGARYPRSPGKLPDIVRQPDSGASRYGCRDRCYDQGFFRLREKVPLEAGEYTMDHAAGVFLMKSDGSFGGMMDMHEPRETRLEKLRRIARDQVTGS